MSQKLSLVKGPSSIPLWTATLGALVEIQADVHGDRTALVFPSQGIRRSYRELHERSTVITKALIESGLRHGDCVGIFAGNCCEYLEIFLAAGSIGCPVVVLNSNYTPTELSYAVAFSKCKMLCLARYPGPNRDSTPHIDKLAREQSKVQLVIFDDQEYKRSHSAVLTFDDLLQQGLNSQLEVLEVAKRKSRVRADDILNYQFTSGTTGAPKAAMLSHLNIINNARFMGDAIALTKDDIVCCPPPLFHCFGLVMGFLCAFTRGSTIVYPSQQFDGKLVLEAAEKERCTVILGVPTMFSAELDALPKVARRPRHLRTALAAGAPVPPTVVKRLEEKMGITNVIIAYGMTETSPVTFATSVNDSYERQLSTVGRVFPHTRAKIVDPADGTIVARGAKGEICTAGYALQRGYLENEAKTLEVMRTDEDGVVWMHTGDEGIIDEEGYCRVTGRIKDLIIRGGENIAPTEIEDRLLSHSSITEAAVVGLPHAKFGEQVAGFLRLAEGLSRPSVADLAAWVRETLGRHKACEHVFWIGDEGVGEDYPKTASGKHQKHVLRDIGAALIKPTEVRAKL